MYKKALLIALVSIITLFFTSCSRDMEEKKEETIDYYWKHREAFEEIKDYLCEQVDDGGQYTYMMGRVYYEPFRESFNEKKESIRIIEDCESMLDVLREGEIQSITTDFYNREIQTSIIMFLTKGYGKNVTATQFIIYYSSNDSPICMDGSQVLRSVPITESDGGWVIYRTPWNEKHPIIRNMDYYTEKIMDNWYFALVED